ncbi:hypothetical protein RJ53_03720 [Methanocalculus chunghsingensis]|uniref:Metallo-beta-lactamase domain-containing protein n=1 Tax=Methanocalculus chunghsingensis TaxID=156457 RepID=A0A8J7W9L4_9EURY|nr:MBL fold metallo-hydrolase [Methanocalculus chunghsingensis]MBR1368662.1 hypothetical protein [Methanocalculus chunghsingensis]
MESHRWNRIPGCDNISIYPIIRKIDTVSSNSFLLASDTECILLDPGGLATQTDEILSVIRGKKEEGCMLERILLTHTHIDHSFSLLHNDELRGYADRVCTHISGAEVLRTGDTGISQAALLGREMHPCTIGMPLFLEEGDTAGCGLKEEEISFTDEMSILAYHTPGHSPDSICYRLGNNLFIGDTLFIGAPGVAGSVGWSKNDCISSLHGLMRLIKNEGITSCLSGHGDPIPASSAMTSIARIVDDVEKIDNIATITPEWARTTATFGNDLMAEMDKTLTIISGRITFISHMLEELEEEDEADRIDRIIEISAIDDLLTRYHDFSEAYRKGEHRDIQLAQKAAQIAGKLNRMVDRGNLGTIIDPILLEHLTSLINDYMTVFRGYQPVATLSTCNPNAIYAEVMRSFTGERDPGNLLAAESGEEFLAAMIREMGTIRVVQQGYLTIQSEEASLDVVMDKRRFRRAMQRLIEETAASGCDGMEIAITSPDRSQVTITCTPDRPVLDEQTIRYFIQAFLLTGGSIRETKDRITITYPSQRSII